MEADYPHRCPACAGQAYVGLNRVSCASDQCKHWDGKAREATLRLTVPDGFQYWVHTGPGKIAINGLSGWLPPTPSTQPNQVYSLDTSDDDDDTDD
jgi:hypothetical protein